MSRREDSTSLEQFLEREFSDQQIDNASLLADAAAVSTVASCQTANDCGSNHVCAGGVCVPADAVIRAVNDQFGAPSTPLASAPGYASSVASNCGSGSSGGSGGCIGPGSGSNCSPGSSCGRGYGNLYNPNQLICCDGNGNKGPKYSCAGGPWQCEPCTPPNKGCNKFCDDSYKLFGRRSAGCQNPNDGAPLDCGECLSCGLNDTCQDTGGGPCWCKPGNEGCPKCETCESSGSCSRSKGVCNSSCSCRVKCDCGQEYTGTWSQEYFSNGLACTHACRRALYQAKCVEGGGNDCPPYDPCKADPANKCELECQCVTRITPCDQTPKCPSGWKCSIMGKVFAAVGENGGCADYPPGTTWIPGGIRWFVRECKIKKNDPDCDECDCNCENDCPDCYKCNTEGKCVYDEDCEEPCDVPCNGSCCFGSQTCKPACQWQIVDACHGQGGTITAPCDSSPSLQHIANISAKDAVCSRFHTHCNVRNRFGNNIGTHLDCQKGLKKLGPTGANMCG